MATDTSQLLSEAKKNLREILEQNNLYDEVLA